MWELPRDFEILALKREAMSSQIRLALFAVFTFCVWLNLPPSFAQSQTSFDSRLSRYELQVFGKVHPDLAFKRRIDLLEQAIWKKDMPWSVVESLDEIEKILFGGTIPKAKKNQEIDNPEPLGAAPWSPSTDTKDDFGNVNVKAASENNEAEKLFSEAIACNDSGRTADAVELLKRVLVIDPRHLDALINLGTILENARQFKIARGYYEKALEIAPDDPEVREMIATVDKEIADNYDEKKHKGFDPGSDNGLTQKYRKTIYAEAVSEFKNHDFIGAQKNLEKLLDLRPGDDEILFLLSRVLMAQRKKYEAIARLNQAIALSPGNRTYQDALVQAQSTDFAAEATAKRLGFPKDDTAGIKAMKPEGGETMFRATNGPVGRAVRAGITGAAIGLLIGLELGIMSSGYH